ncbi:MAG: SDR family oxidoreductase [Candidatus Tectomicrobia bacterium]|uniref:SDR family oxidoreductase n=1 Tax=Tectimicrobiota bacterium TaxID=2528274 RepID=A0A932GPC1_UNCTE|nr:SDR family oxidoreductase [Candidatus Tectomicrobia bacterium]
MDLGLRDKAVLITGGSRGLGKAIAAGFAAEGCRVAICARGQERLESAAGEWRGLGATVVAFRADVTRDEEAKAFVEEATRQFGSIDVLVNNVGGSRSGGVLETQDRDWSEILEINLLSTVRMCRLVVPGMKERRAGRIINIASVFGREWGGSMIYNAAKAGVISFSKFLSRELAPHNILVNSVAPGSILFPGGSWERRRQENPEAIARFVEQELPLGRFGRPEEVAHMVVFLASEKASLVSGASIAVDGSQSRSLI